jgi:hypothetical protein
MKPKEDAGLARELLEEAGHQVGSGVDWHGAIALPKILA